MSRPLDQFIGRDGKLVKIYKGSTGVWVTQSGRGCDVVLMDSKGMTPSPAGDAARLKHGENK